jgi:endonuclease IV
MTSEHKKETEPKTSQPDVGFTSYIYPFDIPDKECHDRKWEKLIGSTVATGPVELQYEPYFDTDYWKSIRSIVSSIETGLSVHAPTQDRDIASEDDTKRAWSLQEYKSAMDLTDTIRGSFMILHLTPQDDMENREEQLERGLESFRELTEYKNKKGYGFKVLIETLEYPKWPSDIKETEDVLKIVKKIDPEVGFCVDVAHLWHNVTSLHPDIQGNNFPEYLGAYLETVEKISSVERIHLGGAFVQEEENGHLHETHRFPGLPPDTELAPDTPLIFNGKPEGFQGKWMEINPVLKVISKFSRQKCERKGEKPDIIVEIHDQDPRVQKLAAEKIKEQLEIISASN